MRILISEFVTNPAIDYLKGHGYEVVQGEARTKADMRSLLPGCDGLLLRIAPCDSEVIDSGDRLRVIAKHGVGVDNIDVAHATKRGILVTYTPEANANSVAEHALYLMIACAKNGYALDTKLRQSGDFAFKNSFIGTELEGKTLGLIGLGRIGRRMGNKAHHGLGMEVVGYDPFIEPKNAPEGIRLLESRDALLACSDFVSIHMPVTPVTRGFINLSELKKMKPGAILINCARGELVVTEDLVQALREGIIRGAGIDVFETEPPGIGHPLFSLDNVVLTPHVGGGARESLDRMGLHAAMGIHEALSGQPVSWPANKV